MSLLRQRSADLGSLLPQRLGKKGASVSVTTSSALKHSAVWASIRLRADLMSSMPIDVFRRLPGQMMDTEAPKPNVLITPSSHGDGQPMDISEWMYSTQSDLDKIGNSFGLIAGRDGMALPTLIDPQPAEQVTVVVKKGRIDHYRISGTKYDPADVWHERQFTTSGSHVGLSPVAYAAASIGGALSAQQFALDWFSNGAVPGAILKNTGRKLDPAESAVAKQRFLASVSIGEPFVTGSDWEYSMLQAKASESEFIKEMEFSISDIARFFGVPGDMIDAPISGSAVTYANVTQRNLQLLIMNMGPAVMRRERALSRLTLSPSKVKLNTDAMLRMDPETRQRMFKLQIDSRTLAPSEARALNNFAPFTPEQLQEFDIFRGAESEQSPAAEAKQLAEIVQKIYLGVGTVISEEEARVILQSAGANINPSSPIGDTL
ncbi:phage portal protein [Pseudarthrobacter sulfonivorans]|uniref:phage portal protein n=1 Tax=Pseudarthrobacter sulfonivorans TaxID=121292 RepID=UPI0009FA1029|nr:phage portal protein [Pseudarthrobacter sulfonivorans]